MSEEYFLQENHEIHPQELKDILTGFLGQTYGEISKYDANIVSENPFLSPKKREFQMVAEKVLQEAVPSTQRTKQIPVSNHPVHIPQPYIPQPQNFQPVDNSQLEFNFDNSITAITINNRLNDIEKLLKKLDKTVSSMVEYLSKYEANNKEQI